MWHCLSRKPFEIERNGQKIGIPWGIMHVVHIFDQVLKILTLATILEISEILKSYDFRKFCLYQKPLKIEQNGRKFGIPCGLLCKFNHKNSKKNQNFKKISLSRKPLEIEQNGRKFGIPSGIMHHYACSTKNFQKF